MRQSAAPSSPCSTFPKFKETSKRHPSTSQINNARAVFSLCRSLQYQKSPGDLRSNGGEKQSVRTKFHTCISAMSEERLRLTDVRIPFTNSNKCRAAWTKVRSSKGILQEFRSNLSPNPRIAQIIRCDDNDESGLSPKRLRSTLKSGTQP